MAKLFASGGSRTHGFRVCGVLRRRRLHARVSRREILPGREDRQIGEGISNMQLATIASLLG